MIFSLNWVKKYVNLDNIPLEELTETLSQSLAEVESVTDLGTVYKDIVIAEVKKVDKHPNADKLVVVQIDIGAKDTKQIVTAASNFSTGDYVVYLPIGCRVPYNAYPERFDGIIKPMKLRGVDSEGMIASAKELKLGDDHSGIWIVPENDELKPKAGMPLAEYLDWQGEYMLEIENKALTHRGDAFSIEGIAREISAAFDRELTRSSDLQQAEKVKVEPEGNELPLSVEIKSTQNCPRYSAVVLDNIKISESPLWLKSLLAKYEIQSINNLVDLTNYIMLEMGQPLHAFDYDKLVQVAGENPQITVREARAGEKIETLDNKEHELYEDTTLITANDIPVAIGGIIGGTETAIDANTKRVVIESANFNRYSIRRSSMRLGLFTDAATIFSRYQDPNKTTLGLKRMIQLLRRTGKQTVKVASDIKDAYPKEFKPQKVEFSMQSASRFIGEKLPADKVISKLGRLEFAPEHKNGSDDLVKLTIPTFRDDISIPADIYEEIARLYGLNKLPEDLPGRPATVPPVNQLLRFKNKLREILVSAGLYDTLNFNFISTQTYNNVNLTTDHCYRITNAISKDVEYMRSLLLPSLLVKAQENLRYYNVFGLFEIGKVHRKDLTYKDINAQPVMYTPAKQFDDPDNLPVEDEHLSIVLTDKNNKYDGASYFWGKQYTDLLVSRLNIPQVEYNHMSEFSNKAKVQFPLWMKSAYAMYNPARTAIVTANIEDKNVYLGIVGEPHAKAAKKLGLPPYTVGIELGLHILMDASRSIKYQEPSKYPIVEQDYCFVVDKDVPYEAVTKSVRAVNDNKYDGEKLLVRAIQPVDIYQPENTPGTKQVTIRVTIQSDRQTLTEEVINQIRTDIVKSVEQDTGGKLKEN